MLIELLVAVAVGTAAGAAVALIHNLRQRWQDEGATLTLPESIQVDMSQTDQKMITCSQELVHETFGDNLATHMASLNRQERVTTVINFAEELTRAYGLDDVTVEPYCTEDLRDWGAYVQDRKNNQTEKKLKINVYALCVEPSNAHFEDCILEVLDTVFHELRHAIQLRSIAESGFWDVDTERQILWASNMIHYIKPEVDYRGYRRQPIEADAVTFATAVMNGVH